MKLVQLKKLLISLFYLSLLPCIALCAPVQDKALSTPLQIEVKSHGILRDLSIGLAGAFIGSVIGFLLNMWWDNRKYKRDLFQKENLVLTAINEELSANLDILIKNKTSVQRDLHAICNSMSNVEPLSSLHNGIWDLLRIHLPAKLSSKDALSKVRDVVYITNRLNHWIQTRENSRINTLLTEESHKTLMNIYNNNIVNQTNLLNEAIIILRKLLINIILKGMVSVIEVKVSKQLNNIIKSKIIKQHIEGIESIDIVGLEDKDYTSIDITIDSTKEEEIISALKALNISGILSIESQGN